MRERGREQHEAIDHTLVRLHKTHSTHVVRVNYVLEERLELSGCGEAEDHLVALQEGLERLNVRLTTERSDQDEK